MVEVHHHRPTLKQKNKPFKSKHATKSSLKDAAKGKIPRKTPKESTTSNLATQSRINRKNHAKQAQIIKRNALVSATRVFNGVDGAPRIVAVIPLSPDVSTKVAASLIMESLDLSLEECVEDGLWKIRADRFKTSIQFRTVPYRKFYEALDACKVADYVVFVLSTVVEVDTWGDTLLRTLQAQGLPEVVTVVSPDPSIDAKSRLGIFKSLLSFIQYFVPSQSRIFDLSTSSDRLNALRTISEGKPSDVRWKEGRSYILGEAAEWENGSLKVTGVLRGSPLSANRLIHIPNFGDYQISKILSAPETRRSKANDSVMSVEATVLAEPDSSSADSLVSTNDPDDLANEQTWPTEEEILNTTVEGEMDMPDAPSGTTPKTIRRIPKGMSEYQAAWIIDDDEDDAGDNDSGQNGDSPGPSTYLDEDEEMVDMVVDDKTDADPGDNAMFEDLDIDEEKNQLAKWRNRKREEADDLSFPDEVDTPQDVPARTRFQRFRGMRSFRSSPWDPFENLPRDYARIFQFEDIKRTEHAVRRRAQEEPALVQPGVRVTVFLQNAPKEAAIPALSIFSLLQHEHKTTVLNFTIQRNTEYEGSVRSKDPLLLCVGPRRLLVNPIYSQQSPGGAKGANNVHKFERYLRHSSTYVATTYGPITLGKQPCILLRETADIQAPHLVAMGSFQNPDTTRIIAKKIILTGHPFKVHKKTATIRYMFFNADDVLYFKPIQLHTKHGRTGHIRESLGTHGYFKAHFDGPINQMDTICMSLYKRVYPKWATQWTPTTGEASSDAMDI